MDKVTLSDNLICDALLVPTDAVDKCLASANESQIKIYLYLLKNRHVEEKMSVSRIADYFNYSEQDVKRALKFWNVSLEKTEEIRREDRSQSTREEGNVVEFAKRGAYTNKALAEFAKIPEVSQLLFVAEQYMARPLKQEEISSIIYMYDGLSLSTEHIEYLIEYCISSNKKTFRSMEGVACDWKQAGVSSVLEAKRLTRKVPKEMGEVMACLGFSKDRAAAEAEINYVRRWTESYGYTMEIIRIACERTVLSTGKPSLRYANSIIKSWHEAGVEKVSDILRLDEEFKQKKLNEAAPKKSAKAAAVRADKKETKKSTGKFNNFSQREYDFSSLMDDIMSN